MKFVATILIFTLSLNAALVNAVAIVVGGKPITLYDIDRVMQQHRLSENQAAEYLVQQALEDIEVAKLGIEVSDYEVDLELRQMASNNGLSLEQLREMVRNSGMNFEEYKSDFKSQIRTRKLFDAIAMRGISQPSSQALQIHYENNAQKFTSFESAKVVQYMATDAQRLERFVQDPFSSSQGIQRNQLEIQSSELDQNLLFMIENSKERSFTPIISVGDSYLTFFIESKEGEVLKPFANVKNEVMQSWREAQREDEVRLHFQKVRAQTDIQIIR